MPASTLAHNGFVNDAKRQPHTSMVVMLLKEAVLGERRNRDE